MSLIDNLKNTFNSSSGNNTNNDSILKAGIGIGLAVVVLGIVFSFTYQWQSTKYATSKIDNTFYIIADELNIRMEGNENASIIKVVSFGTKLTKESELGGWSKIKCDGTQGYVKSYLIVSQNDYKELESVVPAGESVLGLMEKSKHRLAVIAAVKELRINKGNNAPLMMQEKGITKKLSNANDYVFTLYDETYSHTFIYSLDTTSDEPILLHYEATTGKQKVTNVKKDKNGKFIISYSKNKQDAKEQQPDKKDKELEKAERSEKADVPAEPRTVKQTQKESNTPTTVETPTTKKGPGFTLTPVNENEIYQGE